MTPTANTHSTTQADTEPETTRAQFLRVCQIEIDRLEPGTQFVAPSLLGRTWDAFSERAEPQLLGNWLSRAVRNGTIIGVVSRGIQPSPRMSRWEKTE